MVKHMVKNARNTVQYKAIKKFADAPICIWSFTGMCTTPTQTHLCWKKSAREGEKRMELAGEGSGLNSGGTYITIYSNQGGNGRTRVTGKMVLSKREKSRAWELDFNNLSLMPVDSPFAIYQDELSARSHGLALWNPNPPKKIYEFVSIGDVGFLHEGSFIRMFNATLPWDHPSNGLLGKPEPYHPLYSGPFTNTIEAQFDEVVHVSRSVTAETNADE